MSADHTPVYPQCTCPCWLLCCSVVRRSGIWRYGCRCGINMMRVHALQMMGATREVTKQCGRCGQTKTAPCYSPDSTTYDGLHPVCRLCAGTKPLLPEQRAEDEPLAAPPHWLTGPAQGLALASQPKMTHRQGLSLGFRVTAYLIRSLVNATRAARRDEEACRPLLPPISRNIGPFGSLFLSAGHQHSD